MIVTKRILFFFVHPSKFHVFRNTINKLKAKGHGVDIIIISKDILVDLVEREGWNYTNLFPRGRKIKGVSAYISSAIYFILTILKLFKHTRKRKYDLFITDDLLVYIGRLKKVPTFTLIDSDLKAVRHFALVLRFTDYVIAPRITDLGKYNRKKISFDGYKELAYLHPNHFTPNIDIVKEFNPELKPYFILRLVNLGAYHDVGMQGLNNTNVKKLIATLETKGLVYITSERRLPEDFEKYRLHINPLDIAHVLYYANLFVGDSQTMTSEAAILGTPAFRCNDFIGKLSVMEEKVTKYMLSFSYSPSQFLNMIQDIENLISKKNFKKEFSKRRNIMLGDKIDLNKFLLWLFENYPKNKKMISETYDYQKRFIGIDNKSNI